jgi:hypothetical protein
LSGGGFLFFPAGAQMGRILDRWSFRRAVRDWRHYVM